MRTEEITIRVDPEAAQAYRTPPDDVRRKLDLLLNIRLQDALRSRGSLQDLMREIRRKAQERGLTAEILESIVHEHREPLNLG